VDATFVLAIASGHPTYPKLTGPLLADDPQAEKTKLATASTATTAARRHHCTIILIRSSRFDLQLQRVYLFFGELHSFDQGVGHRVVLFQAGPHHGMQRSGVVDLPHRVLRVFEVVEVVLGVHPVRRPAEERERLLVTVRPLQGSQHGRSVRRDEIHVQVVLRDDLVLYTLHKQGARLDAGDLVHLRFVEVFQALYVHVIRHGNAVLGLPQVPGLFQQNGLAAGSLHVGLMGWHSGVQKSVRVPTGDALEDRTNIGQL
jgi:hypothetical protein